MNAQATTEMQLVEEAHAQPMQLVTQQPMSPMQLMQQAAAQGTSLETLERMWALQVKFEERQAEKAFVDAMAEFKKNPPKIVKDKRVFFQGKSGPATDYMHATHYGVTSAIVEGLSKVGISHKWVVDQTGKTIGVTCTLTHKLGHSESVRLEATHDDSGGKNAIQAMVSAKSYLERHTLTAVTGMSTSDMAAEDDDGRGSSGADAALELQADWIDNVNAALNDATLMRTWAMAQDAIAPLNRLDVYTAVREAVAAKRAALKGPK